MELSTNLSPAHFAQVFDIPRKVPCYGAIPFSPYLHLSSTTSSGHYYHYCGESSFHTLWLCVHHLGHWRKHLLLNSAFTDVLVLFGEQCICETHTLSNIKILSVGMPYRTTTPLEQWEKVPRVYAFEKREPGLWKAQTSITAEGCGEWEWEWMDCGA